MIKNIIISIVRQLLSALLGGAITWLIAQGAVTSIQIDVLLAAIAAMAVNLAWAVITNMITNWKIKAGLLMPSGTRGAVLHEASQVVGDIQKLKEVWKDDVTLPTEQVIVEDERVTKGLQ